MDASAKPYVAMFAGIAATHKPPRALAAVLPEYFRQLMIAAALGRAAPGSHVLPAAMHGLED
jgi:hypothetical protein